MKQKNGKIELLRFLFATVTLLFHATKIKGCEDGFLLAGAFAVEFFFIVAGFLMMAAVAKQRALAESIPVGKETFRFLKAEASAFYPEVVFSWLLALVMFAFASQYDFAQTMELALKTMGDLLLVKASGLSISSVNGVVWYLSAMLIAMAILYPLLRKYTDMMLHVVLPLAAVLLMGYLCQETETLRGPEEWLGLCTRGLPRALAEISIGAVCYPLCQKLRSLKLSTLGRALCTVAEWGIYVFILWFMWADTSSSKDFFYVLLLAVAVTLTFSQQSLDAKWYDNKLCRWLGKFSMSVYLSHMVWYKAINKVAPSAVSTQYKVIVYVIMAMLSALLVYCISEKWRKSHPKREKACRKHLLVE